MRVRPREDLNSIAWILWHIARAEDIILNPVLAGRSQVLDDAWVKRLGIARRDFGIGMTSAEVWDLTSKIDVGAVREYRDAVGRRTREIVEGFRPEDWQGQTEAAAGARRRRGGVRRAGRADRQGVHGPAAQPAAERHRIVPSGGTPRRSDHGAQRGRLRRGDLK